ncbi:MULTISPECIES: hypothetical protein [Brenneria]|uniref:Uncharacterized protein n=1 Tax=Brenneria nigrifluens DSM 30175 = ATCC 13028 TaxID=1121120 RepID=A0ABX5V1Q7_9GAMM|nr:MULTISPECIES: hypothetical protein [Brenneria]EHD22676.1 hypothetical protein BrE312_3311 [Brenneria sp. EniD312]QCR05656.1 hypothetical protein EH206_16590 [Brenneria nigrifluens DSM 30175 = ATCC 13028]
MALPSAPGAAGTFVGELNPHGPDVSPVAFGYAGTAGLPALDIDDRNQAASAVRQGIACFPEVYDG